MSKKKGYNCQNFRSADKTMEDTEMTSHVHIHIRLPFLNVHIQQNASEIPNSHLDARQRSFSNACTGLDSDMRIILNLSVLLDPTCDQQFLSSLTINILASHCVKTCDSLNRRCFCCVFKVMIFFVSPLH